MIRAFRQRLGAGNRFFQEEVKARLHRYVFSSTLSAGVNLFIPGHGLIVYYNWAYAQKNMVGTLRNNQFLAPSTGESVSDDLPRYDPGLVFPFLFGDSNAASDLGALMGSTRELERSVAEAVTRSKHRRLRDRKVCVCDVLVYIIHGRLPLVGDVLPCSCRASKDIISALASYLRLRRGEISQGGRWELDFSIFARLLRRTGAVLHREPGLGALLLFSKEVIESELTILFRTDRIEVASNGVKMPPVSPGPERRIDRLIQESYISTLPTCRYLQYH
jgi:hypothetical protein